MLKRTTLILCFHLKTKIDPKIDTEVQDEADKVAPKLNLLFESKRNEIEEEKVMEREMQNGRQEGETQNKLDAEAEQAIDTNENKESSSHELV